MSRKLYECAGARRCARGASRCSLDAQRARAAACFRVLTGLNYAHNINYNAKYIKVLVMISNINS